MISVNIKGKKGVRVLQELTNVLSELDKKVLDANDIADIASTILISRVRRRYMKQLNPDGSKWPVSKAAKWRGRGELTWADGGKYAPKGWKTGGFTLFSSGNLFHSIQLVKVGPGVRAVVSDVEYAKEYMALPRIIIGVNDNDLALVVNAIAVRIRSALG